jgi:hypothetical protein
MSRDAWSARVTLKTLPISLTATEWELSATIGVVEPTQTR